MSREDHTDDFENQLNKEFPNLNNPITQQNVEAEGAIDDIIESIKDRPTVLIQQNADRTFRVARLSRDKIVGDQEAMIFLTQAIRSILEKRLTERSFFQAMGRVIDFEDFIMDRLK